MTTTQVSRNTAAQGGGVWIAGPSTITSSTITANTAQQDGGGLWEGLAARSTVADTIISGNRAADDGGGVWHGGGTTMTLTRVAIVRNHADSEAGGFYNTLSDPTPQGALPSPAFLTDSAVVANTAPTGGGILNESILTRTRSVVSGNKVGDCVDASGGTGC